MAGADAFRLRPGVLELIAGIALSRVEGAAGIGMRGDHAEDARQRRKNLTRGIKSEVGEGMAVLDLDVSIDYGKDFRDIAASIQADVKGAVEGMTGWTVEAVGVNVVGVNAL